MAGVQMVGFYGMEDDGGSKDGKTERESATTQISYCTRRLLGRKVRLRHTLTTNPPGTTPAMVNGRRRAAEARKYRMVASFFFFFFLGGGENGDI